ncbi:MAG: thioesterase family protein [Woeseia sp.]
MSDVQGFIVTGGAVPAEWIDINGHMNVAYYVLAFDKAVDDLWARLGITDEYIRSGAGTTFAVECHVTYQRELREADPYRVTSEILAYDEKRIHQFQRMYHAEENFLAATAEWMNLHVNLETRRVSLWPASVLQALEEFTGSQIESEFPQEAGKRMSIAKPVYSMRTRSAAG